MVYIHMLQASKKKDFTHLQIGLWSRRTSEYKTISNIEVE